jgi:uncharacterized protein
MKIKNTPYRKFEWTPEMKAAPAQYYEEDRTVEFYAAVWGNKDMADDILYKGCCAKSIAEHGPDSTSNQKILMLAYHDMSKPIGKLLSITEDDHGLLCKAEIAKTAAGEEVIELIKSGVVNQFSIGFKYIWDKVRYEEEDETFHVYEIKLFEVSAVSIGANEMTGTKGIDQDDLSKRTEILLKSLSPEIGLTIRQYMAEWCALGQSLPQKAQVESEPKAPEVSVLEKVEKLKELLIKNQ